MIAIDRLVHVALGDADDAETAAVEEHVLACNACATTFERLVRIGMAARELVHTGGIGFPVTTSLAERLQAEGLVSRSYDMKRDGILPCSVNASDIYALATLNADFAGVTRASIVITLPTGARRMEDVPFDAARGTASYVTRSSDLRKLPSGRVTLELYANEPSERLLGRYFLDHSAFVGT